MLLTIDTEKIKNNLLKVIKLCESRGVSLVVVTKVFCSFPPLVDALSGMGVVSIADSNYMNFKRLKTRIKKILIKTLSSDIDSGLEFCDVIHISDFNFLKKIALLPGDYERKVLLNVEIGDNKEGILPDEVIAFIKEADVYNNISIIGIAGNTGCLSGNLPDQTVFSLLNALSLKIRSETGVKNPVISVGGTVFLDALIDGSMGEAVNQIRVGEGIFFGYDSSKNKNIPGFDRTAFIISIEVLEVLEKEIAFIPVSGYNAFGKKASAVSDKTSGRRKRAVLGAGILAVSPEGLVPVLDGIKVEGITYDFMVLDITGCEEAIRAGDTVLFYADYSSVARASINPYVDIRLL